MKRYKPIIINPVKRKVIKLKSMDQSANNMSLKLLDEVRRKRSEQGTPLDATLKSTNSK